MFSIARATTQQSIKSYTTQPNRVFKRQMNIQCKKPEWATGESSSFALSVCFLWFSLNSISIINMLSSKNIRYDERQMSEDAFLFT